MIKRSYFLVLWLSAAGCVGDWSQVRGDGGEERAEAGVDPIAPDDGASDEDAGTSAADASALDADGLWDATALPDAIAPTGDAALDASAASQEDASPDAQTFVSDGGEDAGPDAEPAVRTAAIASVDSACRVPLELACSAHNAALKLVCMSGKWTFDRSCDGATRCDTRFGVSQGTCQAITTRCLGKQPGAAVCDGTARKSCGLDLLDEVPNDCPAHTHCEGDGSCVCDRGYMASASGCVDIPDCPANACANGQCVEGTETYSCTCKSGFRPAPDGKSCVDMPDCTPGICGSGGTCVEGVNDYSCTCVSGYEKKAGAKACSNIDDCATSPCGTPDVGTCHDGLNSYSCSCTPPYVQFSWDGVSQLCLHPCEVPCGCGGCG